MGVEDAGSRLGWRRLIPPLALSLLEIKKPRLVFVLVFDPLATTTVRRSLFQGYMVLEEGDAVTPIEGWFFIPWLSKFAEREGVRDY